MSKLLALALILGAAPAKKAATSMASPVKEDPWEFDRLTAKVRVKGVPADELTTLAVTQLAIPLETTAVLNVSAHANSVGGVTLRFEDPADPKLGCSLYATLADGAVVFKDSRCSFSLFTGQLRTVGTCRKISGTARRIKDTIALEADAPDCTAQPMGMPMSVRATAKPR